MSLFIQSHAVNRQSSMAGGFATGATAGVSKSDRQIERNDPASVWHVFSQCHFDINLLFLRRIRHASFCDPVCLFNHLLPPMIHNLFLEVLLDQMPGVTAPMPHREGVDGNLILCVDGSS